MKKRVFGVLICVIMVFSLICIVSAENAGYMTFHPYGIYKAEEPLDAVPATYEAWVKIPEGGTSKSGRIISNRRSVAYNSFYFDISAAGYPVLNFTNKEPNGVLSAKTYTFEEVGVANGAWTHVAITYDAVGNTVSCYINGELTGTQATTFVPVPSPLCPVLGGDNSSGNNNYFRGELKSVTLYADVRTPEEIKADMVSVNNADEKLMAHYDLSEAEFGNSNIGDLTGNYNMVYDPFWYYDASNEPDEYAYSIAIIGDQQVLPRYYPSKLHYIYDWILENKDTKKIGYVISLGDITSQYDDADEWQLAQNQFKRLAGILPLAACRGNHDYSEPYNTYMNYEGYTSDILGIGGDLLENVYKTVKLGNTDYLIITLDLGPSDEILAWAGEVTAAHPDHKVIVVTHSYMADDGTTTDANDVTAATTVGGVNNADAIWEKYVRKYENIVLVLSGHIDSDEIRATKSIGDHGNVVTQMLINPQGIDIYNPSGLVCMLYFNEEGNMVTTEYFSTVKRQYYNVKVNHYTMFLGERSGDMDGDGNVTLSDALTALRAWLDGAPASGADINGDGKVTLFEVVSILKICSK